MLLLPTCGAHDRRLQSVEEGARIGVTKKRPEASVDTDTRLPATPVRLTPGPDDNALLKARLDAVIRRLQIRRTPRRLLSIGARARGKLFVVRGDIAGAPCKMLIDSGAEENFMSMELARQCGLKAAPVVDGRAELADGSLTDLFLTTESPRVTMGAHEENIDFHVLDLSQHEVMLGYPWLEKRIPRIDWRNRRMLLGVNNRPVVIKGEKAPDPDFLMSAKQVSRILKKKRNNIFCLAIRQVKETASYQEARNAIPAIAQKVLDDFQDLCVEKLPKGLPPPRGLDHHIKLKDGSEPATRPVRRLSEKECDESREQLTELLEKGLIRPSKSPWGAPVLFAPKPNGGLRMCIDCRALNRMTARNQCPLPLPGDIFEKLDGATIFSKIDLTQGLYQTRLSDSSIEKPAFRCRRGHFEWMVVPFGLTNAPATFISLMGQVLRKHIGKLVLARLDDILVHSKSEEEHAQHLRAAHESLKENKLCCHPKKCEFAKTEVELLGHVVPKEGVSVEQTKIKKVTEWPTPRRKLDVESFLGLANYYRRLVRRFSKIAKPLTAVTGNREFIWASSQQRAFEELKHELTHAPTLRCCSPDEPITITTDASDYAIAGVLSQGPVNNHRPVAYFSRALRSAAQNYPPHERELMAIVESVKHWKVYAHGKRFTAHSDHNPLEHLFTQERISKRQARWLETLADFDLQIKRIRGDDNKVADALSRQLLASNEKTSSRLLKEAHQKLMPKQLVSLNAALNAATKVSLSNSEKEKIVAERQADGTFQCQCRGPRAPCKRENVFLRFHDKLCAPRGHLRRVLLQECHDIPAAGHLGARKTVSRASERYYWPQMKREAQERARACVPCQSNKALTQKKQGLLQPLQIPTRKWGSVSMGFVMPLPETADGFNAVLVCVGRLTKTACFVPTHLTVDAKGVAKLYHDQVFRYHGMPGEIVSDRGPRLTSDFWKAIAEALEVDLAMPTSHHPQADGQAERMSRALEEMLRARVNVSQDNWADLLTDLEFACNSSVSDTTGQTPFIMSYGQHPKSMQGALLSTNTPREARGLLESMQDAAQSAKTAIKGSQLTQKKHADKKRRDISFSPGDLALLSAKSITLPVPPRCAKKLLPKHVGPFEITQKCGELSYKSLLPPQRECHDVLHVDRLRAAHQKEGDARTESPPPADVFDDGHTEQEVGRIAAHRFRGIRGRKPKGQVGKRRRVQFLVRYKGFASHEDQWIGEDDLQNCLEAARDYRSRVGATLN